jgi:mono/diheme cytochrome c family protein
MTPIIRTAAAASLAACLAFVAQADVGPGQQAVLDHFAELAKQADSQFSGFSVARGEAFFLARQTTGNVDTPSCSTCHTTNPRNEGQTTVGKAISPMAVSRTPDRFTDLAKVEKWFRRNCDTVIGRECTPQEKGDFIAFMSSL